MNKLRVLMYHKIDAVQSDYLTVSQVQFRKQLEYIRKNYHVIRLSQLIEYIRGHLTLPPCPLLLTFDDGYENNFRLAYPILKEMNLPFAVFPVAGFIGKTLEYDGHQQSFMSPEQLAEMSGSAEYAYHGFMHADLMNLGEKERKDEINSTLALIKKIPLTFLPAWAYTFGSFPKKDALDFERLKNHFKETGLECAFRIGNRLNALPLNDPYRIERLDIRGSESWFRFKLKIRFGKVFP